jgi:hypothetical protein
MIQNLLQVYGLGHLKPRCDGRGPLDLAFGALSLPRDFLPRATSLALRVRAFGVPVGVCFLLFLPEVAGLSEACSLSVAG